MILSIDVSPPGIYSVRIVTLNNGEDTVSYNITDTETVGEKYLIFLNVVLLLTLMIVSTIVPKLRVNLISESPRLIAGNTSVEAEFEVSRPVAGVRCYLRSQTDRVYKNCKLKG